MPCDFAGMVLTDVESGSCGSMRWTARKVRVSSRKNAHPDGGVGLRRSSGRASPWCSAAGLARFGDLRGWGWVAFKSGCFLPLISRQRVMGVLRLTRLQEQAFTQDEVEFLSQVAGQVAIAVENALDYRTSRNRTND